MPWSASVSLRETLGWRYFTEHRGLDIGRLDNLDHAVRWHADICAVVAVMTDPITNEQTGIHRTFLNPDGTIARNPDGTGKRMMLASSGSPATRMGPRVSASLRASRTDSPFYFPAGRRYGPPHRLAPSRASRC